MADRCVAAAEAQRAAVDEAVAALERIVEREVLAVPSAAEVSRQLEERVGFVAGALAKAEARLVKEGAGQRAVEAETRHLQATLGARLGALEQVVHAPTP